MLTVKSFPLDHYSLPEFVDFSATNYILGQFCLVIKKSQIKRRGYKIIFVWCIEYYEPSVIGMVIGGVF